MPSRFAPFAVAGIFLTAITIMGVVPPALERLPPETGLVLMAAVAPVVLGFYGRLLLAAWGETIIGAVRVMQAVAPESNSVTLQSSNSDAQKQDKAPLVPPLPSGVVHLAHAARMTRTEAIRTFYRLDPAEGGPKYTAAGAAIDAACAAEGVTLQAQRGRYALNRPWKLVVDAEPIPGTENGQPRTFERGE